MRKAWTAFLYFQKGMTMIYNGQEVSAAHRPQLFEKTLLIGKTARIFPSCSVSSMRSSRIPFLQAALTRLRRCPEM